MGEGIMLHRVKRRIPKFTYTGDYEVINDKNGNWRIKFKSSGTLTFTSLGNAKKGIDVFLVGGGGGGKSHYRNPEFSGSGGGGGYTKTQKNISVAKGTGYYINVGAARNSSSAFGYTANPGTDGSAGHSDVSDAPYASGGNGGSGGGSATFAYYPAGGTDGSDAPRKGSNWGLGQHSTTREFGEPTGDLYSAGGGYGTPYVANSGNGGFAMWSQTTIAPSSGIVIIRNHRE